MNIESVSHFEHQAYIQIPIYRYGDPHQSKRATVTQSAILDHQSSIP
jgi:hypothetical protein